MKLSKKYITLRLAGNTTVHELAVEIATEASKNYPSHLVKMDESIAKFEKMLSPFAPKETRS
jgi:hypothetical protein